jgi:hypothetical protein
MSQQESHRWEYQKKLGAFFYWRCKDCGFDCAGTGPNVSMADCWWRHTGPEMDSRYSAPECKKKDAVIGAADAEQLDIGKLLTYWEAMLPNERKALLAIARRLYWGQKEYGPLAFGKKDWAKEAQEEAFDMAVYLAASLTLKPEDGK